MIHLLKQGVNTSTSPLKKQSDKNCLDNQQLVY